jgi:hypothetical protein
VWESKSLDEEIKDNKSIRKKECGKVRKQKKPPLDAFEHRVRRNERQAGEALKTWVKLT